MDLELEKMGKTGLLKLVRSIGPSRFTASVSSRCAGLAMLSPVCVLDMVEKPAVEDAPSRMAVLGRYIITPAIFDILAHTLPGKGGEIQLTDALQVLADRQPVYAYDFEGTRYDLGDKLGFLKATVEFALRREDLGEAFRAYLTELVPQI